MLKNKSLKPLIGVTLDSESPGGYSKFPWYAVRQNYMNALIKASGIPVALPHDVNITKNIIESVDGILITGGNFDLDPKHFGAKYRHEKVQTKDTRTTFELSLAQFALEKDMPILGICGGQQLLNVAFGGTLIQHIPDEIDNALNHEQINPRNESSHNINIERESQLFKIVKKKKMLVNSAHHQSVNKVASGFKTNAFADDGVIEGIEAKNCNFCIGVQWHPEFEIDEGDKKLFSSFVSAASKYAKQ